MSTEQAESASCPCGSSGSLPSSFSATFAKKGDAACLLENSYTSQLSKILDNVFGVSSHVKGKTLMIFMFDGSVMPTQKTSEITDVVNENLLAKIFPELVMHAIWAREHKVVDVDDQGQVVVVWET